MRFDVIMSVVISLMVSMSSSSCSVSNRLLNSSSNSISFDPFRVAFTVDPQCFPFHLYVQSDVAHSLMWPRPMLTWAMTVASVTKSGVFVVNFVLRYTVPFGLTSISSLPYSAT